MSISTFCEIVGMSRQNFYKGRRFRRQLAIDEEFVLGLVRQQRCKHPFIGTRKLHYMLGNEFFISGVKLGRDRFFRLLGKNGLLVKRRRRSVRTTYSGHGFRVYGNVLRGTVLTGPCQAVASDITYIRTDEGFMYLALVMDCYSRTVLGYDCSDSLELHGAMRALLMTLRKVGNTKGLIHHSDRGIQYCSGDYIRKLKSHGVVISMTEEGHCYENSQAERLNGILKHEYGLDGRFKTKCDAKRAVAEAIELYNSWRPHQSLGYRCPMDVHAA